MSKVPQFKVTWKTKQIITLGDEKVNLKENSFFKSTSFDFNYVKPCLDLVQL